MPGTVKGGAIASEGLICLKSAENSLCQCHVDTIDLTVELFTFQCLILSVKIWFDNYKFDWHFQSWETCELDVSLGCFNGGLTNNLFVS